MKRKKGVKNKGKIGGGGRQKKVKETGMMEDLKVDLQGKKMEEDKPREVEQEIQEEVRG